MKLKVSLDGQQHTMKVYRRYSQSVSYRIRARREIDRSTRDALKGDWPSVSALRSMLWAYGLELVRARR